MKVRLISDIHMEFWRDYSPEHYSLGPDWFYKPNDVIILAGDITVGPTRLEAALNHFAKISNHVIFVYGNHEFYGGHTLEKFDKMQLPNNVHILNPGFVKIDDITFIGATLWTDFRNDAFAGMQAGHGIADFSRMRIGNPARAFRPHDAINLFNEHYDYIRQAHDKLPGKKVIITHFLPSPECISPYWQKQGGLLNKYFAPDLTEFINTLENTPYWFFGHTHDQINIQINNTQFVANPYGYHNSETHANEAFQPNLTFEI